MYPRILLFTAFAWTILLGHLCGCDTVEEKCEERCDNILCKNGCQLYRKAIQRGCNSPCTNKTAWVETGSFQRQFCLQGCQRALGIYAQEMSAIVAPMMQRPVIVRDTETESSVEIRWESKLISNVTYLLQIKNVDLSADWTLFNRSEVISTHLILVNNLQPFTTYQFRVLAILTQETFLESDESISVTTKANGVPGDSPRITHLSTPSPSVISVSWDPPTRPNGPLLVYKIMVVPDNRDRIRTVTKEVPSNVSSWMFSQLQPSSPYKLFLSARNYQGEGPVSVRDISTPNPGNLTKRETPYLILGADNMVLRQNLISLQAQSETIHRDHNTSILMTGAEILYQCEDGNYATGIGVHVEKQLLFVSDSVGKLLRISLSNRSLSVAVYPKMNRPESLTVDWLNNYVYVVNKDKIYRCLVERTDCYVVVDELEMTPTDIKVDPINGFLYFTIADESHGLYRVELADLEDTSTPERKLIIQNKLLSSFTIDYDNIQLYFPNETNNTMLSTFFDGSALSDIRPNVIRPDFHHVISMVYHQGLFYWTNGKTVLQEEYDPLRQSYRHNNMLFFENHFRGFNMLHPSAQPRPDPRSPPSDMEVIFSDTKAYAQWKKPTKLHYQGCGAWNIWDYEVKVEEMKKVNITSQLEHEIDGLSPDTQYEVKVRAVSITGDGPWSESFLGKTLKKYTIPPMVLMGMKSGITRVSLDGKKVITNNIDRGVGDIAWYKKNVFWTGTGLFRGRVFSNIPFSLEFYDIADASCLAFDWLGKKLYWSNVKQIVIRRCDMSGENIEVVYPTSAKQLIIDSVQGRLYWITTHSVETAYLNGGQPKEYFVVPHFAGQEIHSLALDHDSHQIYWVVRSFDSQDLYMSPTVEQTERKLRTTVQWVGRLGSVSRRPSLHVFSNRLIWMDSDDNLIMGNLKGNYSAVIKHAEENISSMVIVHPSLQPYPDGLDEKSLVLIPRGISQPSIQVTGEYDGFNISWLPSSEVNYMYDRVMYKMSLETPNQQYDIVKEIPWHELSGIPAYSLFTVSVRAFTYWGYSPWVTRTLRSPMSVPSVPLTPRIYITKRKDTQTSDLSTAADFRWSTPLSVNGIIDHQFVFYRHGNKSGPWDSQTIEPSSRHFILDNLESNCTYFFQVQACTMIGCGPRTDIKSAVTDAENPVPKLLIASPSGLKLLEVEDGHNSSVTMATASPIAMTFLAQDEKLYWIDQSNSLVEDYQNQQRQMLSLNGTGKDLSVDWVSRTLYIAVQYDDASAILSYDLERQIVREIIRRPYVIGSVLADPFSSVIFWTESHGDEGGFLMRSHVTGDQILTMLSSDNLTSRKKRGVMDRCNCSQESDIAPVVAVDHSMKGMTRLYFVKNDAMSLVATDTNTCQCDVKLTTTSQDQKGLPPDSLTADHTHIYWSKSDDGVHSLDKSTGNYAVLSKQIGVTSIEAYGQHLQPLPGANCLDPSVENKSLELVSTGNTSLTFRVNQPVRPDVCQTITMPALKYTVYYSDSPEGEISQVSCEQTDFPCEKVETYNNEITVFDLKPFTYYIVQLAVSNYYTEYLSEEMGPPAVYRTRMGVPSPAGNVTVFVVLPDQINVRFSVPSNPNGPLDRILYVVKWTTYTDKKGQLEGQTTPFMGYEDEYQLVKSVPDLKPATTYDIKILAFEESQQYFSESSVAKATTFNALEPFNCTGVTKTSINISWTSPTDGSIHSHNFFIKKYVPDELMEDGDWQSPGMTVTFNNTQYNETFTNLEPGTRYVFKLIVAYRSSSVVTLPREPMNPFENYIFETKYAAVVALDDEKTLIVAITLAVIAMIFFIVLALLCFFMRYRNVHKKRKPCLFVNGARVPDTELAILRELPHTTVQQNNTLYALSIIPTDEEVEALPHFGRDELNLTKFLGSGAFGEVFEGVAKNILSLESGETKVAVKTLRKSASEQEKEEFLKEALLMSNFKHEHILSLLGVCLDNDPQFIILELMEAGDLLSFLRNSRPSGGNPALLNLCDLMKMCVHVARGCGYLEDMHFVHRDLAARNCLVSCKDPAAMSVKIGDFGLARDIYKNDYYRKEGEGLLPVRWMSPESLVDGVFTTQSDIWAFGVLVWEVITLGQQPYPARTNIEVLHYVRAGGRLDRPETCSDELYDLLTNCWNCPQEDRPCFATILEQLEAFYEKSLDEESEFCAPWIKHMANKDGYVRPNQPSTGEPSPGSSSAGAEAFSETRKKELNNNNCGSKPTSPVSASAYLQPQKFPPYLELISDPSDSPALTEPSGGARPKNGTQPLSASSGESKYPGTKYAQMNAPVPSTSSVKGTPNQKTPKPGIHYAKLASFDAEEGVSDSELDSRSIDSLENLPLAPGLVESIPSPCPVSYSHVHPINVENNQIPSPSPVSYSHIHPINVENNQIPSPSPVSYSHVHPMNVENNQIPSPCPVSYSHVHPINVENNQIPSPSPVSYSHVHPMNVENNQIPSPCPVSYSHVHPINVENNQIPSPCPVSYSHVHPMNVENNPYMTPVLNTPPRYTQDPELHPENCTSSSPPKQCVNVEKDKQRDLTLL